MKNKYFGKASSYDKRTFAIYRGKEIFFWAIYALNAQMPPDHHHALLHGFASKKSVN